MRIEPDEPAFDPAAWEPGDAERHLARGVELFNAADYAGAHEEFELVWLSTQGADSDFYKGLIQACIALHHFQRGNLDGAAKLYGGHRRYLAAYLPVHHGLAIADFLDAMQSALRPVLRRAAGAEIAFDPAVRPRLSAARDAG